MLALVALARGDRAHARDLLQQALEISERLGHRFSQAWELEHVGVVAQAEGDIVTAQRLHQQALALRRALDDRWGMAQSLVSLGAVARRQGDYASAGAYLKEALDVARVLHDPWEIACCLEEVAELRAAQGRFDLAARLYGAAAALWESLGIAGRGDVRALGGAAQAVRAEFIAGPLARAWEEGRQMSLAEALADAELVCL